MIYNAAITHLTNVYSLCAGRARLGATSSGSYDEDDRGPDSSDNYFDGGDGDYTDSPEGGAGLDSADYAAASVAANSAVHGFVSDDAPQVSIWRCYLRPRSFPVVAWLLLLFVNCFCKHKRLIN